MQLASVLALLHQGFPGNRCTLHKLSNHTSSSMALSFPHTIFRMKETRPSWLASAIVSGSLSPQLAPPSSMERAL